MHNALNLQNSFQRSESLKEEKEASGTFRQYENRNDLCLNFRANVVMPAPELVSLECPDF